MATVADFHDAAARYRQLGEALCRQAAVLAGWHVEAQLGTGPAAAKVKDHLAWAVADLDWASRELAWLASECIRRADICEAFRRSLRAWWATPEDIRGPYPVPPYRWVSA
jgi:hypothetical protein